MLKKDRQSLKQGRLAHVATTDHFDDDLLHARHQTSTEQRQN